MIAMSSHSETIMAFMGTVGVGLAGYSLWGAVTQGSLFPLVFALAGVVAASLAVSEIADEPMYLDIGIRVATFGAWLWVTVVIADLLNQTDPLLLPNPYITVLVGVASGTMMLSAFQSAGWINGPLLWGES